MPTYYVNLSTGNDASGGTTAATAVKTIAQGISKCANSGDTLVIYRGTAIIAGGIEYWVDLSGTLDTTTMPVGATILANISGKSITITRGFHPNAPAPGITGTGCPCTSTALGATTTYAVSGDIVNVVNISKWYVNLSSGSDTIDENGRIQAAFVAARPVRITVGAARSVGAFRTIDTAFTNVPTGGVIDVTRGTAPAMTFYVDLSGQTGTATASPQYVPITRDSKSFTISPGYFADAACRGITGAAATYNPVAVGISGDTIQVANPPILYHRTTGTTSDAATVQTVQSSKTFTITNGVMATIPFATLQGLYAQAAIGTRIDSNTAPFLSSAKADAAYPYTHLSVIEVDGVKTHTTTFKSITQAIANVVPGSTIDVSGGEYSEAITISKSIILNGAGTDSTIVRGVFGQGTITVTGYSEIGNIEIRNMRIISADVNANTETGAIYIGSVNYSGANTRDIIIENNILDASGESALLTGGGYRINGNFIIRNNIIRGKTFTGSTVPNQTWTGSYFTSRVSLVGGVYTTVASGGISAQFIVPDMPKQLFAINAPVYTAGITTNTIIEGNIFEGTTGGLMTGMPDEPVNYRANMVATIDISGAIIRNNIFRGTCYSATSGAFALRVRGTGCQVTDNTFEDPTNKGYLYDNKTEVGDSATSVTRFRSVINFYGNTLVFDASANEYTVDPSGVTYNSLDPSGTVIITVKDALGNDVSANAVSFLREGIALTPTAGTPAFYIGAGKLQFRDKSLVILSPLLRGGFISDASANAAAAAGDTIRLLDASGQTVSAPLNANITKSVFVQDVDGLLVYAANAELSHANAGSAVVRLMPESVSTGVPATPVNAKALSATPYLRATSAGSGVLTRTWYVITAGDLLSLGLSAPIEGVVNPLTIPTPQNITPLVLMNGVSGVEVTVSSSGGAVSSSGTDLSGVVLPVAVFNQNIDVPPGNTFTISVPNQEPIKIVEPSGAAITLVVKDPVNVDATFTVPANAGQVAVQVLGPGEFIVARKADADQTNNVSIEFDKITYVIDDNGRVKSNTGETVALLDSNGRFSILQPPARTTLG